MSIAPLLSLAGIAAGPVVEIAARAVENLDFSRLLHPSAAEADDRMIDANPTPERTTLLADAQEALTKFREMLAPRLAALGVDLSQPVLLALDAMGNVRETSGHPQGTLIEQVFATDDRLRDTLSQVAAQFEILHATEEHQRFSELYHQNPDLAVAQFAHLFDDRPASPVQIKLIDEEVSTNVPN